MSEGRELAAVPPSVQGRREVSAPPEVHSHLLGLFQVDAEVFISAPTLQLFHLLPVVGLVLLGNESNHSCVIRERHHQTARVSH